MADGKSQSTSLPPAPKRVLVCGGRDYSDWAKVQEVLGDLHAAYRIGMVLHGAATGADSLADRWARQQLIAQTRFAADWDAHGKAAGPIRNQQMLDEGRPDLVIAFPGGRGTADMMRRAKDKGVEIHRVR